MNLDKHTTLKEEYLIFDQVSKKKKSTNQIKRKELDDVIKDSDIHKLKKVSVLLETLDN